MPRFVVLGSHPGDGGVVQAKGFYDAFVKFMQDSYGSTEEERKQIRADIKRDAKTHKLKLLKHDASSATYGSYEINRLSD